ARPLKARSGKARGAARGIASPATIGRELGGADDGPRLVGGADLGNDDAGGAEFERLADIPLIGAAHAHQRLDAAQESGQHQLFHLQVDIDGRVFGIDEGEIEPPIGGHFDRCRRAGVESRSESGFASLELVGQCGVVGSRQLCLLEVVAPEGYLRLGAMKLASSGVLGLAKSSSDAPSSQTRPSCMKMVRLATLRANPISWVTS